MTKFFKNLQQKKEVNPTPRPFAEIQQDYGKTVSDAGQTQYQIYVYTEELERLNAKLRSINQEAAARQALDKKEAAAAPVEQEVSDAKVV